jgi:DMSO/TMAO reductase YedYZ molybdopterin-dependent catalytic subunit
MTAKSIRETEIRARIESSTVLIAAFAGIAGVMGSYAVAGYTPPFIASPIASFLVGVMPDLVIRFAIVTLTAIGQQFGISHLGQRFNLLLALVLGVSLLSGTSLAAIVIGRRIHSVTVTVGLVGVLCWLVTVGITSAPLSALGAGGASAAVVAVAMFASVSTLPGEVSVTKERRRVLGSLTSMISIAIGGYLLGQRQRSRSVSADLNGLNDNDAVDDTDIGQRSEGEDGDRSETTIEELLEIAEERSLDIEGLEGLVSGMDFYEVDINNINPVVDASTWTISVTGNVENEVTYTYKNIISMNRDLRFVTLRCVSDPLNGHKMDNDLWAGVPLMKLIDEANPQGEYVMLRAVDDYYEEFTIEALRNGFLAYGKNNDILPRNHGYPARALIPGHWGEISVKWITEIEILNGPEKGFWEKRGWHGTGPVNTVAKFHAINYLDNGKIQVGGHAYAGTRGIRRVEVSIDGGDSWHEATLSKQLPAGTSTPEDVKYARSAWRQWEYTYVPPNSGHMVVVRAVDGTGDLQPRTGDDSPYPNGATGWVSKPVIP